MSKDIRRALMIARSTGGKADKKLLHQDGPLSIYKQWGNSYIAEIDGKKVGDLELSARAPYASSVEVHPDHRGTGLASTLYDIAEKDIGRRMMPSPLGLSEPATGFWKKRLNSYESPEEKADIVREAAKVGREAGIGKSAAQRMQSFGYDPDTEKVDGYAKGGSVHPATQIPGVHISERTHGKPIFTGERIAKADGGSMSVFPKPQRMLEGDDFVPGGKYLDAGTKEDVTGHKASEASIVIAPGGKPSFTASRDAVDQTGSPGRGSAAIKANLFKQKAGWRWSQAPEGHEDTSTIVSVEHRGKHHYALAAHFPKGVELARYADASSEPRLRPTTQGNIELGPQVGSINVRGREHPVYEHVIAKADGGIVTGKDDDGEDGIIAYQGGPHSVGPEGYDNAKIGTGEGAAVYGHGHYFAEAEPVAQGYRDRLSPVSIRAKSGELFGGSTEAADYIGGEGRYKDPKGLRDLYDETLGYIQKGDTLDNAITRMHRGFKDFTPPEELAKAESLLREHAPEKVSAGHMHQVLIKGRPEHFLDWDAMLDEQSPHVMQAIEKSDWGHHALEGAEYLADERGRNPTGADMMRWLHEDLEKPEVSQMLADAGIRGIRYLDQASRRRGEGTRNYVVFDPKHIEIQRRYARGGMAYADGGSTPDAGVQKALDLTRDLNPQGLYSHAAEAAMASPQAKGPLPQMLASLKGVKPDEMKYSGVEQAFADQPQVTREQLAQHFTKNIPQLKEVTLRPDGDGGTPKYQAYTLPGGENYREVLLHRPVRPPENYVNDIMAFHREMNGIYGPRWGEDDNPLSPEHQAEFERLENALYKQGDDEYSHAHWPVPNVVGHYRASDRTGPNDEKILHVEEVQSDWAQQARAAKKKRGVAAYDPAKPYQVYDPSTGKVVSQHATPEEANAEEERYNIEQASVGGEKYFSTNHAKMLRIPPAGPFISNTDNATDLILKHILTAAARGNYDKVVFTPGDDQAKRWNEPGLKPYYDETIPKRLNDLVKQHDPDARMEGHDVPMPEPFKKPKDSERIAYEERAGGELSNDQYEALYDYIWDHYRSDLAHRGEHYNPLRMRIPEDIWEAGLNHAMRLPGVEPSEEKKALPGINMTPRLREGINKRGFKAYARGGDVEGTMRIAKAGGGPLGDDEAVKKALALTAQAQAPAPQQAVQTARRLPVSTPAVNPASPLMQQAFQAENRPGIVVSPRPGKGSGPPITREMPKTVPDIYSKFPVYSDHPDLQYENEPWNPSTPNLIGAPKPPPVQEPVRETPRMKNVTRSVQAIFKTKGFNDLIEDLTKTETSPGIRNLEVTPIQGTWKNELEPSFILHHPDMTDEHAAKLAPILGFGKQQDATIRTTYNPSTTQGLPAALIGHPNGISEAKLRKIADLSAAEGLDFSQTKDKKGLKYLHFGSEAEYPDFLDKVNRIADATGLPERGTARAESELIHAKDYLPQIFGTGGSGEGLPAIAKRSPDLFRRIVDHVLAPYAKAIAGEGYRLSPERLQETYGLTDEETDHVRKALYPGKKGDRTTVPLMTGEEDLDVRPTGGRGQANVNDVMYALQNRAARQGQIDPGDFSDTAKDKIAADIASEVSHHVNNSDKSAIGWYDKALKAAMDAYSAHFPQLKTDPDKQMLFHALLGITSQGQNVHENSGHAVRLFDLMENQGMTLPQAVDRLEGTFGDKTRAIEHNLLKFDHLVKNNGYDKMRDVFNQKMSVGEWRKKLREDPSLYDINGKPFSVAGKSNQQVTGWSVFGPKIGSFINNLHGDYSTLTADLWFSRTWNRLLGHNFLHTPSQEADQYRDFRDALKAERMHSPAAEGLSNPRIRMEPSYKTSDGKLRIDPATGKPKSWLYGDDAKKLSEDEYQNALGDPEAMLELAKGLHKEFKDSGYKDKSDLRRRAKNWIENRENSVAAPRSDNERGFQQDTVEQAQKLLKNKYGLDISVADIQAALWFHEKELFGKYGVASEKAQPADYADAAKRTLDLIQSGNLYNVQSKEPKAPKKAPLPKKADGGTVDAALRLVSQYGQPLPNAVNLARQHTRGRP